MPTPPENRERSPYTGWTRAHWESAADRLLLAVRPFASPRYGLVDLPGPRPSWSGARSDGLEGWARTFLLAALRVAGARGEDPYGHLDRYAEGLAAGPAGGLAGAALGVGSGAGTGKGTRTGTRTGTGTGTRTGTGTDLGPDAWPLTTDTRQAIVEAASVALGLRLTRPWLWDRLDDRVREQVVEWLRPALGPSPVDNNWWLFGLTVAGFLQDAGVETDLAAATIDRSLARIEDWYLGDGWYSDGDNRAFDHYNAWALHFYPVLHAHLAGDRELLDRYGPRLRLHLEAYGHLFDTNGSPLPYGRSLIYRFAAAAAPWLGTLTGHTPLTPGATRRLASGTLRHFLDRGATDADGLLTLGWHGPYAPLVQEYSGPGSPYWASKGFLGLLLPADHPAWTDREEALPAERADTARPLGPTGLLVQTTAADGLVRLHNHGSNHVHSGPGAEDDPGYARGAYSTRTGPTTGSAPADNHFALIVDGKATTRGPATPAGTSPTVPYGPGAGTSATDTPGSAPAWAASRHTPRPGVRVLSATLVHGPAEVRAHLVTGAPEGTPVRQTGWATTPGGPHARLQPVHGYDPEHTAAELPTGETLQGPDSRTLALHGVTTGPATLFVALASLTAGPDPDPAAALADVRVTGHVLDVTWRDGAVTRLDLDGLAPDASTEPGA
ncbi:MULTISPECIES: DUF2264 domain-containing protein [unclassified Streptomyces]|uniref:DUF2264 domain-containing protein n=1 Tax=unclassified Streptomyces TaxID=2593676 RepID=UPI00166136CD|nr:MULTISPECIES: DUF2264 domain-containing protein [unclassified Streptomyces]MBD0710091.1 hypothetical protein [Streptomyces sp. CBMA291]MBD0715618.1 hypothetical protein [Streptomyces sp. CBMA370]